MSIMTKIAAAALTATLVSGSAYADDALPPNPAPPSPNDAFIQSCKTVSTMGDFFKCTDAFGGAAWVVISRIPPASYPALERSIATNPACIGVDGKAADGTRYYPPANTAMDRTAPATPELKEAFKRFIQTHIDCSESFMKSIDDAVLSPDMQAQIEARRAFVEAEKTVTLNFK